MHKNKENEYVKTIKDVASSFHGLLFTALHLERQTGSD